MNILEEAPVVIEDDVSDLRCTASAHHGLTCGIEAVAIYSCDCTHRSCYICDPLLVLAMGLMDRGRYCKSCARLITECWAVTPL